MTASGGHGVTLNMIVTGTLIAVADIFEIEVPEFENYIADATTHAATGSYAQWVKTGVKAMGSFKMVLLWDKGVTSHAALLVAFSLPSGVSFQLITPGSDETIYFDGIVQKIGRVTKVKDAYKAEVTIQPTSCPTLT